MPTTTVSVHGLVENRAAFAKLSASLGDMTALNRAGAKVVYDAAMHDVPRRSGRLARSITFGATQADGRVVSPGSVVYAGVVHFGWSSRNATGGMSRKQSHSALSGIFATATINKSFRQSKDRTTYRKDKATGVRTQTSHRGGVRGGPIRATPYMYRAADARRAEVIALNEKQIAALCKLASA